MYICTQNDAAGIMFNHTSSWLWRGMLQNMFETELDALKACGRHQAALAQQAMNTAMAALRYSNDTQERIRLYSGEAS